MSASPRALPVELMLMGSAQYDRRLYLMYTKRFGMSAIVYPRGDTACLVMLAWTSAPWSRVRLQMEPHDDCSLWLGNTAFDVNQDEVKLIRSTYDGCGLHILVDKDYKGDL